MTSVIVYLVGFNGTRANSGQKIQNAGCGQPQDQIRPWGGGTPQTAGEPGVPVRMHQR